MLLLASNATASFHPRVYATDASLGLGAICSTSVTPALARTLWLNGDRRGGYSRLETGATALLSAVGKASPAELDAGSLHPPVPSSGLLFRLDLVEVGLETAPVSDEARSLGLTAGPPFHPASSKHFDLGSPGLLVWFYGYIRALVLHSPALPVRRLSPDAACGFRRAFLLAWRCRVLFSFAVRFARPVLLLSEKGPEPEGGCTLGGGRSI